MYLFCDLETTGLNPRRDVILEFAAALVDNELELLAERNNIFPMCYRVQELLANGDPIVREMHTANHLLVDMARLQAEGNALSHGYYKRVLDYSVLDWLTDIGCEPGELELAGSSVHFDRSFLEEHLPQLAAFVHYRNFDTSTLKRAAMRWAPEYYKRNPIFEQESSHRALSDVRHSIEIARAVANIFSVSETLWPGQPPVVDIP